jgi:hypothetical protein
VTPPGTGGPTPTSRRAARPDLVDLRAHLAAGLAVLESSPWAAPVAVGGLFLFGLAVHFPIFTSPVLDVDEATVGSIAQEILRGRHLYGDLVDRKPPLLFILYALSFLVAGGGSLLPIRVLMVALEVATGLLIGVTLCRQWRHRVAVAALFLMGTATFALADAHAASFEAYFLLPITLAWWFSRKGRAVPTGLALLVATMVKQSAVFTLVPVVYNLWRQPNGPRKVGVMSVTFGGLYLVVGSRFGLRDFLFWNLTGNASYLGASSLLGLATRAGITLAVYGLSHLVLVWLAGRAWADRRVDLDIWLWLGSAFVGVLIGQHFFGHYYLQMLPPLAALAATQIARVDLRRVLGVAATVTVSWVTVAVLLPRPDLPPYVRLVHQIDQLSAPDDPILVWGVFSEATWASDRPMASRFPHTNFVTGVDQGRPTPGALADLCADIERTPPRLIIDTSPANVRDSAKAPLRDVPEMAQVLTGYRRAADVNDIVIYQRVSPTVRCGSGSSGH